MEFRVLGPLEVMDGARSVELPSGRVRALLALLVLQSGEAISSDRLIDELWGSSPPATAATALQGLVSRLRSTLEPERKKGELGSRLQTTATGYRLAVPRDAVDANRFKRLLDEARGSEGDARKAKLAEALALWRGAALADFTYEPFAQRTIGVLEELRLEAVEDRIEADLAAGRAVELLAELEQLGNDHPFRERLHGFHILALYRAGRQADALEAYRSIRTRLVDEIGIEPGQALRDLEAAILRQDPSLDTAPKQRGVSGDGEGGTWLPHERRAVTVVAVDLAPDAGEEADDEALGRAAALVTDTSCDVLQGHGARVERSIGDMVVGFFGVPSAREDDALRAVRAAVDVRRCVEALNDDALPGVRYRTRIGVETGDVVVRGPAGALTDIVAPVVGTAARLQQTGADGDVLIGRRAQRLTRGAVIVEPVVSPFADRRAPTWRVLDIVSGAPAVARTLDAPMFGRQGELTRLRSAFRKSVRSGRPVRITVVGEAGIGKSRLARELLLSIDQEAHVISERCPPFGESASFFPLREALAEAAGFAGWRALHATLAAANGGRVPRVIADAINLRPEPDTVAPFSAAMCRLFEILSAHHPVIVVLDDLHWAEPAFLDVIDAVERDVTGSVLLLCLARPELFERRPELASDLIELGPLPTEDIESIIVDRAGGSIQTPLQQIVERAQGNPLYAEQLLAAAAEGDIDALPASLRALLAMRLDHLGPGERDVLRCASIVGDGATIQALRALLPDEAAPFVERHVGTLDTKRFIDADGPGVGLRFTHVLVRLAAYESMTHEDRGRLHERYADWLEQVEADAKPEVSVAYHREQAELHHRVSGIAASEASHRTA